MQRKQEAVRGSSTSICYLRIHKVVCKCSSIIEKSTQRRLPYTSKVTTKVE